MPCGSSSSCSSSGTMVSSFCQGCDRTGVYSDGSCGTYNSELPIVLSDPTCCPPYGTFLFDSCDGCNSYSNFADGLGGSYQELKNENDVACCPPAGTFLNSFCIGCDRTNVFADGLGGTYDQVELNDTTCPGCGYSVTVHKCDSTHSFSCSGDAYIIDCALENGVDLPYSGLAGADLDAIGLLISGQVDQSSQSILDEDQIASGLFSYEVAYPLSDVEFTICNIWGSSSPPSASASPGSSSSTSLVFSIVNQPSNNSISVGEGTASLFSVAAVSPSPITYKWQISNSAGVTYYDINPNGGVFYGANSPTLGLNAGMADMSSTWNNARFRCVLVSDGTTLVSGYGVLAVG